LAIEKGDWPTSGPYCFTLRKRKPLFIECEVLWALEAILRIQTSDLPARSYTNYAVISIRYRPILILFFSPPQNLTLA
jgi:hypothetical protein